MHYRKMLMQVIDEFTEVANYLRSPKKRSPKQEASPLVARERGSLRESTTPVKVHMYSLILIVSS